MNVLTTMSILAEQIGQAERDMLPFLGASNVAHAMQHA
jgi:hypothetical protein